MKRRVVIAFEVIVGLGILSLYLMLWLPNTFEGDRFINVSKGETFTQVVDSLEANGIIRSRTLFMAAGRLLNLTTRMQIGKYRFKSGMSNKEILEDLRVGKSIEMITVTIPEGLKATRVARLLTKNLGIDLIRFIESVNDPEFVKIFQIEANSLEGFLMPNTYRFYWQADEKDIIKALVGEFWKTFDEGLKARMNARGMSLNDVLTIASIVEGETKVDSERAIVAGVYYNRLKRNIRLQADPTIQYIIENGPRRLHRSDLELDSPYNTYRHYGLPPGPINNPGRAAIVAALYPSRHKYLYFVANGQGGHTFTKTYEEHLRAVKQFRRIQDGEEQSANSLPLRNDAH